MNNSKNETNAPTGGMGDALLDELDDVILRMGRLMSARHFGSECNAPDAITLSQALLMRAIESHGAVKMSEVAALLAIKAPAASAAIDALEREGYVERAADPSDRRVTLVTLTPLGCDALHAAETRRRDAMRRHMAVLTDDEIRTLITIHHKLIDAMVASAP